MSEKPLLLSALFFSGTLALNVATVWSQATPGDKPGPGGAQQPREPKEPGAAGQQKEPGAAGQQWSADDIKKVQQALKEKGHDPGAVDGVMSSKTQQALREFQQKNGLQATGTLNAETAAKLGISAGGKSSPGAGGKSSPGEPGAGGRSSPGEPGAGGKSSPGSGAGSPGGSADK
jgi:peptidoglycan hydrolase-like protein with peptidoglycan-binding domain